MLKDTDKVSIGMGWIEYTTVRISYYKRTVIFRHAGYVGKQSERIAICRLPSVDTKTELDSYYYHYYFYYYYYLHKSHYK